MKPVLLAAAAVVSLLAAPAIAAAPTEREAAELHALAQAGDEAWNAADAARMAALYAADASLVLNGGANRMTGVQEIQAFFEGAFSRRPGVFRHVTEIVGIDVVEPGMAFTDVMVRVEQRQPDGAWKLVRRFDNVSISVRDGTDWKLRVVRAYPRG